jgi:hypothetical protein
MLFSLSVAGVYVDQYGGEGLAVELGRQIITTQCMGIHGVSMVSVKE